MRRIRFLSDQIYEIGGPGKGIRFPEDFVLDRDDVGRVLHLEDASTEYSISFLRRWTNRGVAEFVDEDVETSDLAEITIITGTTSPSVVHPFGMSRHGRATEGVEGPDGVDGAKHNDTLEEMTRAQLDEAAKAASIDSAQFRNKAELIAALRAAASAATESAEN